MDLREVAGVRILQHRTPLSRARGLGSAHDGTIHWWRQRVTAVALVPLGMWLMLNLALLPDADFPAIRHWFASPVNNGLCWLFLISALYHAALGLRVILEDYIAAHGLRWSAIILAQTALWLTGLASALALIRLFVTN